MSGGAQATRGTGRDEQEVRRAEGSDEDCRGGPERDSAESSRPTRAALARLGLSLLPARAFTRAVQRVSALPVPRFARRSLYGGFARVVGARVEEAAAPIESYASFDAFFTRALRDGAREWKAGEGGIGMPCDGRLDARGIVERGTLVQAKGIDYRIEALLGQRETAAEFEGGVYATIYLSPADYHRVHAPCAADVELIRHIPGELLPVNGLSVPFVPALFVANERMVARFRTAEGRVGALVMVAATGVAAISLFRGPELSRDHCGEAVEWRLSPPERYGAGEEFGAFHLGSTVVLVLGAGEGPLSFHPSARTGRRVRLGEPLFETAPVAPRG